MRTDFTSNEGSERPRPELDGHIAPSEAVERIGKALFADAWTGEERTAKTRLERILEFRYRIGARQISGPAYDAVGAARRALEKSRGASETPEEAAAKRWSVAAEQLRVLWRDGKVHCFLLTDRNGSEPLRLSTWQEHGCPELIRQDDPNAVVGRAIWLRTDRHESGLPYVEEVGLAAALPWLGKWMTYSVAVNAVLPILFGKHLIVADSTTDFQDGVIRLLGEQHPKYAEALQRNREREVQIARAERWLETGGLVEDVNGHRLVQTKKVKQAIAQWKYPVRDHRSEAKVTAVSNYESKVRPSLALSRFRQAYTIGPEIPDSQILAEAGYRSFAEYWRAALADPMPASSFVYLLESHLLDPQRTADEIFGRVTRIETQLWQALQGADVASEPWIIRSPGYADDISKGSVRPLEAVKWMHGDSLLRDLLPQSLANLLEGRADGVDREQVTGISSVPTSAEPDSQPVKPRSDKAMASGDTAHVMTSKRKRGAQPGNGLIDDSRSITRILQIMDEAARGNRPITANAAITSVLNESGLPDSHYDSARRRLSRKLSAQRRAVEEETARSWTPNR